MRIRSLINHMYFSKGRFCHDRNHFPVFFAMSDRACVAHLYWTFDRVRLCTLGAIINTRLAYDSRHHEVLSVSRTALFFFVSNVYRYYANHTYTNTVYVLIFATESSTFGPNQSSYTRAASAWPIKLALTSLLNLIYPLLILWCHIYYKHVISIRHLNHRHHRHNHQCITSESECDDCVWTIILYICPCDQCIHTRNCDLYRTEHDGRASRISICLSRANYFKLFDLNS